MLMSLIASFTAICVAAAPLPLSAPTTNPRAALLFERDELAAHRPSVTMPYLVMGLGTGVSVIGACMALADFLTAPVTAFAGTRNPSDGAVAAGVTIVGLLLLTVGLVKLINDTPARDAADARIEDLEDQLKQPAAAPAAT
jgi:hypothetical protein